MMVVRGFSDCDYCLPAYSEADACEGAGTNEITPASPGYESNCACLFGDFFSTFCLETNPSTSLRTSPKVQAVPSLREGIDAEYFFCCAFPRPKSAVGTELS